MNRATLDTLSARVGGKLLLSRTHPLCRPGCHYADDSGYCARYDKSPRSTRAPNSLDKDAGSAIGLKRLSRIMFPRSVWKQP